MERIIADGTFPITIEDGIHIVKLCECILQNMPPEQIGPEIVQIIDKIRVWLMVFCARLMRLQNFVMKISSGD